MERAHREGDEDKEKDKGLNAKPTQRTLILIRPAHTHARHHPNPFTLLSLSSYFRSNRTVIYSNTPLPTVTSVSSAATQSTPFHCSVLHCPVFTQSIPQSTNAAERFKAFATIARLIPFTSSHVIRHIYISSRSITCISIRSSTGSHAETRSDSYT